MLEETKPPVNEEDESVKPLSDYQVAKKLIQLKQSADSRNIAFDLKFTTVKKLLKAKKCYYTGTLFTVDGSTGRSIDRVDSSLGYVDNNVVPCTIDINSKKSNLTITDIELLHKKIQEHRSKNSF